MSQVNQTTDNPPKTESLPNNSKTTKREKAILALLTQPTMEKAALAAGVHLATLYRWQKDPDFQKALLAARREAFSQTVGRLQQASAAAAGMLMRIIADPKAPAGSRVQAAKCVLEQSFKGLENEDLQVRVAQLEDRLSQSDAELLRHDV